MSTSLTLQRGAARGLPQELLRVPALGLETVDDRLRRWGLA